MQKETIVSLRFVHFIIIIIGLLVVLAALTGIGKIVKSPKEISIPVALDLDLKETGQISYTDGETIAVEFTDIRGLMVYKEENPNNAPIAWGEIIFILVRISLYLFVIFLIHKILKTSLDTEPFIKTNAKRMKWVAYSFITLGVLRFIGGIRGLSIVEENLTSQYVNIVNCYSPYEIGRLIARLMLSELPIGLFALFIAALFDHGIALREESDLTI